MRRPYCPTACVSCRTHLRLTAVLDAVMAHDMVNRGAPLTVVDMAAVMHDMLEHVPAAPAHRVPGSPVGDAAVVMPVAMSYCHLDYSPLLTGGRSRLLSTEPEAGADVTTGDVVIASGAFSGSGQYAVYVPTKSLKEDCLRSPPLLPGGVVCLLPFVDCDPPPPRPARDPPLRTAPYAIRTPK